MENYKYYLGIDVGSTTVKMVLVESESDTIVWQDYQRHETKQPEKVLQFLMLIDREFPDIKPQGIRPFITGSGGKNIGRYIGATFVQEVNAVCLAVEKLYPEAGSVIELGGQDAKIVIFKDDPETGRKKKIPSMNDKCAGGTGAVIDKISAKLRIDPKELSNQGYRGVKIHPVAGKCGVFAETDINSLQKQGIPNSELMASLFEAIVSQNLSVLTRGHTLRPHVLLLGGPNTYIKGMREAWEDNIPLIWKERECLLPGNVDPKTLIKVPHRAEYFAALGAVEFGRQEANGVGGYGGYHALEEYIQIGRKNEKKKSSNKGLSRSDEELKAFIQRYTKKPFVPARFVDGQVIEGFIGLDGGSTSTKAILLSKEKDVLIKTYQLSKGNPIEDTKEVFAKLTQHVHSQGAHLKILGVGTTGYAKDILRDVLKADVAIVETVAHTESALHFYANVDVICDVGGQDIKIMILANGQVKDFKLNTQCSAGNGYFLQSTAQDFGVPVEDYAATAFKADAMPTFGYGCAVFMQSDIVDFQRQGWTKEEIMAGLANVLPKNIWLYVSQIPNLSKLGKKFVLQGGTQHNLAAVKAQVDFIESRFIGKEYLPEVIVHDHCGESGAIGAGIEAIRLWENGRQTTFIGLDAVNKITYKSTTNEGTRCHFCKNKCLRTFIDVLVKPPKKEMTTGFESRNALELRDADLPNSKKGQKQFRSKVPLANGAKRLIVGNSCEKGLVEDVNEMRLIKRELEEKLDASPNLVELSSRRVFRSFSQLNVADPIPRWSLSKKAKSRARLMKIRDQLRIGIPRLLNMYSMAPLFSTYFESLGIKAENIVYSDYTSERLYKEGVKRGSIDPCFPSKLGIPHVHNLIDTKHRKRPLNIIFCPMTDDLPSYLTNTVGCRACPTVTATPASIKAAFIKEGDIFKKHSIQFLDTFLNLADQELFSQQMFLQFRDILGLSEPENHRAVAAGYAALDKFEQTMRCRAREILDQLEREQGIGIVVLARPYHHDPGINHDILTEFQKLGYPILSQDSLPLDHDILDRLFGEEVENGTISQPTAINDVWKNSYSENTSRKVWAAKFTARHPNLVALELSNFKCGHDAPIYTVVEEIIESSGTPYFSFKDLDENKSIGSIKIRVETISYFLQRYREKMIQTTNVQRGIEDKLKEYERRLRATDFQTLNGPS